MRTSRRQLLMTLLGAGLPCTGVWATAPRIVLPGLWTDAHDPAAYLVSEKYDGVRGYWDGTSLQFRSGRPVPAPDAFLSRLPKRALDGELWLGRGRFDELSGIVRREVPLDTEWRQVRFMVFELPGHPGTFGERASIIGDIAAETGWPQLLAVEQSPVADRAALTQRLRTTIEGGGEGLALHLATAPYGVGRSDALLKLKQSRDAEATVIDYRPGKGKYSGLVGALEVRTPEGRRFLIGSGLSDEQRSRPPEIGSVITYRYRDLTSTGLPRFATFLRTYSAF